MWRLGLDEGDGVGIEPSQSLVFMFTTDDKACHLEEGYGISDVWFVNNEERKVAVFIIPIKEAWNYVN